MSAYSNARAFRVALEDRLRRLARDSGRPLDRLRKEAAAQRLLARLVAVAPTDDWAPKGGLALIARLGAGARSTRDADTTWGDAAALRAMLDEAVNYDAGTGSVSRSAPDGISAPRAPREDCASRSWPGSTAGSSSASPST